MRRRAKPKKAELAFRTKLVLNQWLIAQLGIESTLIIAEQGKHPFSQLCRLFRDTKSGLNSDRRHFFYDQLTRSDYFQEEDVIDGRQIEQYEDNIVRHTDAINKGRRRRVEWKYFQWLSLLFVEIYLDKYFSDRRRLLGDLNYYVGEFNKCWRQNHSADPELPLYRPEDLNKICLQMATGAGKTLLMHVNLLQYRHYAARRGGDGALTRAVLITPNESLSAQHASELFESGIPHANFTRDRGILTSPSGLARVDIIEITKLGDRDGPSTIATRSFGPCNLLLVDEGHRGMSSKDEGAWVNRRAQLCADGFAIEYSATFEQAVKASKSEEIESSYAKNILFDYSYRWFYEDGFGKDYKILNLPRSYDEAEKLYLTGCLLTFHEQLMEYERDREGMAANNIEKPLWVFAGTTVTGSSKLKQNQTGTSDVAAIVAFIADFLVDQQSAKGRIKTLLTERGTATGLIDEDGKDVFADSFRNLGADRDKQGFESAIYKDILQALFQTSATGGLTMRRIKGGSGEIAMYVGISTTPFGLINVGDSRALSAHLETQEKSGKLGISIADANLVEPMFGSVKNSDSPVNLLIGSKKFIEGWDCWRVSTMGLMNVGRSEGAQIIQLFGRGVRLKGRNWSLKRGRTGERIARPWGIRPGGIGVLETLNVFGISADFMQKFRDYLRNEGLDQEKAPAVFRLPLEVNPANMRNLQFLRARQRTARGKQLSFAADAATPVINGPATELSLPLVVVDAYPRITGTSSIESVSTAEKRVALLDQELLVLIDFDLLFFDVHQYCQERGWNNLIITKDGLRDLLDDGSWYVLYAPESLLAPTGYRAVEQTQALASRLLKLYCERFRNHHKQRFYQLRQELVDLTESDGLVPQEEQYEIVVDGELGGERLVQSIQRFVKRVVDALDGKNDHGNKELRTKSISIADGFGALVFDKHLYNPLLLLTSNKSITVRPVFLNESEAGFVRDLRKWSDTNKDALRAKGIEIALLRNPARGEGVGFFAAGGFYPDFILWILVGGKQHINFVEPHGMIHEGLGSPKVQFSKTIKRVESRLNNPSVVLNSFIVSWTRYKDLSSELSQEELEDKHILFRHDDQTAYIDKLVHKAIRDPNTSESAWPPPALAGAKPE